MTAIAEVTGMEGGRIQTQPLFVHEGGVARGGFSGCGTLPTFSDAWREAGRPLDPALFAGRTPSMAVERTGAACGEPGAGWRP